jgi:hypothetical protein
VNGALTDAALIFFVVIALIVLAAGLLASRRYLLERSGGTVECGLRLITQGDSEFTSGWRIGVLSYQHDELFWYGALGVLLRPERVFRRRALSVVARRPADEAESAALGEDRIVVEISTRPAGSETAESSDGADGADGAGGAGGAEAGDRVELAMTEEALTGFLAWLEASPPGSHLADIA